MKHLNLEMHAQRYAELREADGLQVSCRGQRIAAVCPIPGIAGLPGPIRAAMALQWACTASPLCGRCGQIQRLTVARHFLIYLKAFLPDTEIPASGLLAEERRPRPYLYSDEEIVRMQQATRTSWEPGCARSHSRL